MYAAPSMYILTNTSQMKKEKDWLAPKKFILSIELFWIGLDVH